MLKEIRERWERLFNSAIESAEKSFQFWKDAEERAKEEKRSWSLIRRFKQYRKQAYAELQYQKERKEKKLQEFDEKYGKLG